VVLHFRRRRRSADATVTPPEPAQPTGHPMAHPDFRGQAPDARAFTGHPPDAEASGYQWPVPSDRQAR
jgi:hypothetical protein